MPEVSEQDFAALAAQVASLSSALAVARRRIDDLEEGMTDHIGLDWGESLVDVNSPHPNISANTVEAGGGVVLVNDNGITVEQSTLNKALWFSESFWYGEPGAPGTVMPTTAGTRLSGSGSGTEGEFDLIVTSNLDYTFNNGTGSGDEEAIIVHIHPDQVNIYANTEDFNWGGTYTSSPWNVNWWATPDTGSGSSGRFSFDNMPINLSGFVFGNDTVGNFIHWAGDLWFHFDEARLRFCPSDTYRKTVWLSAFPDATTPAQITGNQDDYAPLDLAVSGADEANVAQAWRLSTDASRNISGIAYGTVLKSIVVFNVGSFDIVLKDEDAGSTAANRFALNGDITLQPDNSTILWYDATSSRWRAV